MSPKHVKPDRGYEAANARCPRCKRVLFQWTFWDGVPEGYDRVFCGNCAWPFLAEEPLSRTRPPPDNEAKVHLADPAKERGIRCNSKSTSPLRTALLDEVTCGHCQDRMT